MIRLRDLVETDLERLFELDQVCFAAGIAYSSAEFRSLLASRRTTGLVAEEGATLAGFVLAQTGRLRGSRGCHIVTIDVDPGFRRRGVGGLLMEELENRMLAAGAKWLRLEVAVDNQAALGFYERMSFAGIGRIADYYGEHLDAFVMQKMLKKKQ